MNPALKVAAGVAGGYLLGRHRKLRYAVGFGAALLGKRMDLNPSRLVLTGVKSLRELPEVMDLGDTVRGELVTSGRRAAATLMTSRLDSLSNTLRERSSALEAGGKTGDGEQTDQQEQPQDDVYPDEEQTETSRIGQRERTPVTRGRSRGELQGREKDRRPRDMDEDDRDRDEPAYDDEDDDIDLRDERDGPAYDDEDELSGDADLRDEDDDVEDEPPPRRRTSRQHAGANA